MRRPASSPAGDQRGFTLVELMVGVFILLGGILGVMTMSDLGNRNLREANSTVAGANLAREVAEHARSIDYDELTPALIVSELQRQPGLEGTGNPWTVRRRNQAYTITVTVCAYDDPRDGLAAPGNGPVNPCPTNGTGTTSSTEQNGDDFRRVDVRLSWVRDARTRQMTQTEMIVNPAGSLGPRIITFSDPVGQITSGSVVSLPVKTTDADAVRWTVESVDAGDAVGGRRDWTVSWNLRSDPGDPDYVYDGIYTMAAQAFSRNIAGDARFVTIALNRNRPFPPPGFVGGRNKRFGGIVDVRWEPSPEPDVRKYTLYRYTSSGERLFICERSRTQVLACTDTASPLPSGQLTYLLHAWDSTDLSAATSPERESWWFSILSAPAEPGLEPLPPGTPTVTVVSGTPVFDWAQPNAADVAFWRVYRREGNHTGQQPTLADRYVTVGTNHFEDPSPKPGTQVTYWFTAVHSSFNESLRSPAVVVVA
jgi:prepilin-type N-terminal cleavage/methylation domain-containing protein